MSDEIDPTGAPPQAQPFQLKLNRFSTGLPLFSAALFAATVLTATPAAVAAPPGCGTNLGAPEIIDAIRSLPPYPSPIGPGWQWSTEPQTFEGNYDPCATLSTALVTVQGATASSPVTALTFHDGHYLGTATSKAYGFTMMDSDRTTDDTVVLDYATPGACDACTPSAVTRVRYQWQGDHVAMLDPAPPSS
jgi:hypothetical protein